MFKISRICFLLFASLMSLFSCEDISEGVVEAPNFWERLEGEWRLTPSYSINGETFLSQGCDQFTTLTFRPLSDGENRKNVPSNLTLSIEQYVEIKNNACDQTFLNWGTILGRRRALPHKTSLEVKLKKECFNCSYFNIQSTDIEYAKTDSLPFEIVKFREDEMTIQFVTNVYNRQIGNTLILDTIALALKKGGSDIFVVSEFNMEDYAKTHWKRFNSTDGDSPIGNALLCSNGINGNALCMIDPSSALAIDVSLKSGTGEDNESTLSFWINPESVSRPKQVIFSKYNNSAGPFIFSLENSRVTLYLNNGFGTLQRIQSVKRVSPGVWTYLAFSYNKGDLLLCINGEVDTRQSVNTWLYDADGTPLIGNSQNGLENNLQEGFVGKIDELIFFERAWNQDVIYQFYQWHLNN